MGASALPHVVIAASLVLLAWSVWAAIHAVVERFGSDRFEESVAQLRVEELAREVLEVHYRQVLSSPEGRRAWRSLLVMAECADLPCRRS